MSSHESTTSRLGRADRGERVDPAPCALVEDLLPLYMENEVSPGSRDLIVEHLGQCQHCAGFLAGAQSVRAQLRQERQQRAAVLEADRPARQALARGQQGISTGMNLFACFLGGMGSMAIYGAFMEESVFLLLNGMALSMGSLAIVLGIARRQRVLTFGGTLGLMVTWMVSIFFSMLIYEESRSPLGMIVWVFAALACALLVGDRRGARTGGETGHGP